MAFYTPNRGRIAERKAICLKVGRGTRSIGANGNKTRPKPKRAVGVAPEIIITKWLDGIILLFRELVPETSLMHSMMLILSIYLEAI